MIERKNMELHRFVLQERKNIFLARQISARRRGNGYHTRLLLYGYWGFSTVLPAKSDSDVMFVYKVARDLESIDHLCINPIHRIGIIHK